MTKNRLIFYSVFALFHIILILFTFYVDASKNDFGALLGLLKWLPWAKYASLMGFLLLIVDFFWVKSLFRSSEKDKLVLENELNTLKAKLFDMQEAARNTTSVHGGSNPKA